MSAKSPAPTLRDVIARYERRLETARRVQELVEDDPELAQELAAALTIANNGKTPARDRTTGRPTIFQQIKAIFEHNGNQWRTGPELMKEAGLKRGAVAYTLYKAHRDAFERKPHPKSDKLVLWRLKTSDSEGGAP